MKFLIDHRPYIFQIQMEDYYFIECSIYTLQRDPGPLCASPQVEDALVQRSVQLQLP